MKEYKSKLNTTLAILSMLAREFKFSRDSWECKQRAVKSIYIFKAGGLNLGYGFGWYKAGPHSDDIGRDLYTIISQHSKYDETKDKSKWNFCEDNWKRLRETNEQFIEGRNLRNLELMTSLHFIRTTWEVYWPSSLDALKCFRKNHSNKTLFDDSKISDLELEKSLADAEKLIEYRASYDC